MSNECQYCDREFDTERGLAVHKGRSHNEPWTDESLFRELRIEKRLNTRELADRWGCSHGTVSRWERKHGIEKCEVKPWTDEEKMERLYVEDDLSVEDVADELECAYATALRWLKIHDIDVSTPMHRYDESISSGGYRFIKYWKNDMQFGLRVHRLVAYAHGMIDFNGLFDPSVVVHHKNDIPWVNSPENLEAMNVGEHIRHHFDEAQES